MASEDRFERSRGGLSTGELHGVLASANRRDVPRYVRDRDEQVATLEEPAGCLVGGEGGPGDPSEAAMVLHYRTLQMLAETGAIDCDHRRKVTRYRGHARLEGLLSVASAA